MGQACSNPAHVQAAATFALALSGAGDEIDRWSAAVCN